MKRSPLNRKTPLRSNTRLQSVTPRPAANYQAALASSAAKKLARASRQAILANLESERRLASPESLPHQESQLRLSPSTDQLSNSSDASVNPQLSVLPTVSPQFFISFTKAGKVQRKRIAPRSRTNRKRARNIPYMLWIKTLPCAVCGRNGAEAAHTGARGLGQKAPDEQCIPLCPDHHRHRRDALDVAGPRRFEEIHGIDIKALVVRLQGAWKLLQDNPPVTAFNPEPAGVPCES